MQECYDGFDGIAKFVDDSSWWSEEPAGTHEKLIGQRERCFSADYDSVASRTSIKETRADMDRETVVSSPFESVSKEKRHRDQNQAKSPPNP